jgi:hypothetical protein
VTQILITTDELVTVVQDGRIMCSLDTGEEALLRPEGAGFDPDSLAEQRALDEDLPMVGLSRNDIDVIGHGGTAAVLANFGSAGYFRVLVRIMTPDELLDAHERVCRTFGVEPTMTYAKAEELTATL